MGLVQAEKTLGGNAHLRRHPAAVFGDLGRIVVRADAGVEACIDAAGDAAVAVEECVAQAGNGREQRRSRYHRAPALPSCAASAASLNPARSARCGSETASTLNIDPMPPRPPPIRRFS